jgi:transposase-like protein
MLQRLRCALSNESLFKLGHNKGGSGVEVDEAFIGGSLKFMHKERRVRYNAKGGATGKTVVQGMLDRDLRQVRASVVPNIKRETLQNEVLANVRYGSRVFTDEAVAYDKLHWRFVHDVVNHMETYVKGQVHTNGIENFWSLLKRSLRGTYVAVEPFHLQRYVDEQVFRFNNRATKDNPLSDSDRFVAALAQVAGKRLTWKELTGRGEIPASD